MSLEINQQIGVKIPSAFWQKWFKKTFLVLKIRKNWEVSLALVDEKTIKRLNYIYRQKNQVTDVLSFSQKEQKLNFADKNYLGEIIICYSQAKKQAIKKGDSLNQELALLLVHGLLHLFGFDHEKSVAKAKKMFSVQQKILES